MAHVVSLPNTPTTIGDGPLTLHQVPAARDNLVWLLSTPDGEAAAVDGPEAGAVLAYCERHDLRLTTLFNTHAHWDHIGINQDLERRGLLAGMRVVASAHLAQVTPGITEPVEDGQPVTFGAVAGRALLTEGHVDGHIAYHFDGVVFTGDSLFTGGCGYLFDGPPRKMFRTLSKLAALPTETLVCCAHEYTEDNLRFAWSVEPDNDDLAARIRDARRLRREGRSTVPSTIAVERATNPFLRTTSESLQRAVATALGRLELRDPSEVFQATRQLKDRKDYRALPPEALPG